MRVIIENNSTDALLFTADYIVSKINEFHPTETRPFNLVLPNPLPSVKGLFTTLVLAYQKQQVSFRHVKFFQLEEFRGISKYDSRSFAYRLYECFFKFVDALPENVFFLNGIAKDYIKECEDFERAIEKVGGIHLCCVEVDSEGGIGGNSPASSFQSRTRQKTRSTFIFYNQPPPRYGLQDVDYSSEKDEDVIGSNFVLTMGLHTIMESSEVFALLLGEFSSRAAHHILEEPITNLFPASILQLHERTCMMCERCSISNLKFTNVEYFVGLRENFNVVNSLGTRLKSTSSPYHHAYKYIETVFEDYSLDSEPFKLSGSFGLEKLRSLSPHTSVDDL